MKSGLKRRAKSRQTCRHTPSFLVRSPERWYSQDSEKSWNGKRAHACSNNVTMQSPVCRCTAEQGPPAPCRLCAEGCSAVLHHAGQCRLAVVAGGMGGIEVKYNNGSFRTAFCPQRTSAAAYCKPMCMVVITYPGTIQAQPCLALGTRRRVSAWRFLRALGGTLGGPLGCP